jgi:hypothetical protein
MEKIRLRPVIVKGSEFKANYQNTAQQMFLLKALKITQDPKKLKEMMGVKTVAEVYQTLDKLAMRKEYHKSLAKAGISFDYITKGIKELADGAEKDDTRLKAFQTLLKSVGMEKYDVDAQGAGGTWEEVLLKKIEEDKTNDVSALPAPVKYDVVIPEIPASERLHQKEEEEVTGSVYDTK